MEILSSIEVRWFIGHDDPTAKAATQWFEGTPVEGSRENRYLVTGREDIAFKAPVEEGKPTKVETKYLLGSLRETQLHGAVVGDIERWRKLSLDLVDPTLERDGIWARVSKARRLRKYRYGDGIVSQISDVKNNRPDIGCGLELTELDYQIPFSHGSGERCQGRALTLGLEAFGPKHILIDLLLRVCEVAFASAPDSLCLASKSSSSYPRWLDRVAGVP